MAESGPNVSYASAGGAASWHPALRPSTPFINDPNRYERQDTAGIDLVPDTQITNQQTPSYNGSKAEGEAVSQFESNPSEHHPLPVVESGAHAQPEHGPSARDNEVSIPAEPAGITSEMGE